MRVKVTLLTEDIVNKDVYIVEDFELSRSYHKFILGCGLLNNWQQIQYNL